MVIMKRVLIQCKQTVSPVKRDVIQIYDSDDENSIFQMQEAKKLNLKKAQEVHRLRKRIYKMQLSFAEF